MNIHVRWAALCFLAWTAPAAGAVDEAAVARALARGVDYLKQSQSKDGVWTRQAGGTIGATALAGLALLECGVSPDDPVIQKAAKAVRAGAIPLTDTYSISLGILFFDRLGEAGDVPLIEWLMIRLLAGQSADGGWSYECPKVGAAEVRRWQDLVKDRKASERPGEEADGKQSTRELPLLLQEQLALAERLRSETAGGRMSDNSNSQFAALALWVGQRHGLPVEKAAARIDARFRTTQNADGGWGYYGSGPTSATTPAMTCAGLLGLAVADGVANKILGGWRKLDTAARAEGARTPRGAARLPKPRPRRDPARDRSVRAGLLALATLLARSIPARPEPGNDMPNYYFLWSLERVAMVFGLQTIGDRDWYGWGAAFAVAQQRSDGSWDGGYAAGGVDTSFALLFLRRSNLVRDLTASLRGTVHDPGEVALKAGGLLAGAATTPSSAPPPASAQAGRSDRTGTDRDAKLLPPELPALPDGRPALSLEQSATDPEVRRLRAELVQAAPSQRAGLLEKLKASKGTVYTQALATAIPHLSGRSKLNARDALAERMARMTAATLRDKLHDEDVEIRRAAALACAMKEEKKFIPDLIPLLDDRAAAVVRAAHVALKTLAGQDFGPALGASRAECSQAMAAWKSWWAGQAGPPISANSPAADQPLTDQEKLQGTWLLTALEREGKALPKAQVEKLLLRIRFSGAHVTFEYPDHTERGTYKLEPAADPKTIDVETALAASKGIYRLEGDCLMICGVPSGDERPTAFATKRGTRQSLLVLKRQKR